MPYVAVENRRIYYEVAEPDVHRSAGTESWVLLLHGFASNIETNWQATSWWTNLTQAGHSIVAMELRSHGRSDTFPEREDHHPAKMARDSLKILDALNLRRVAVFGYSLGVRVAANLAISWPERVRALVFGGMATQLIRPMPNTEAIAKALKEDRPSHALNTQALAFRKFADRTHSNRMALATAIHGVRQPVPRDALSAITLPTLVIAGSKDTISGDPIELAGWMANARGVSVPDRNHMNMTGDHRFKSEVIGFLRPLLH